jgi:hypothetical protein
MAGEGTNDAAGSIDTTAAGDIWNYTFTSFTTPLAASSGSGTLKYTTPELTDGLTLVASLAPKSTATAGGTSVGYGINYTGIDGLTVNLATAENNGTALKEDDMNVMKASYAYGPVTVAVSQNEYDAQTATDAKKYLLMLYRTRYQKIFLYHTDQRHMKMMQLAHQMMLSLHLTVLHTLQVE